jgi:heat shock protein HslJ
MRGSGRIVLGAVLPLLLLLSGCFGSNVPLDHPMEVDSCDQLIGVGIELVNDYVSTLEDTDLGPTQGDPEKLPTSVVALNLRGEELDARIVQLDCDADAINQAIADATAGIESDNPVVATFLESVRGGIVAPILPAYGKWLLQAGTVAGESFSPVENHPITLVLERNAASGYGGCNGYFFPISLAGGSWSWGEGTGNVTEQECQAENEDVLGRVKNAETTYLRALRMVSGYDLTDGDLVLTGDGVELRFVRESEQAAG